MADGSSGNIGGILFEAGKAVGNTVKSQAQQTVNAIGGQVTGNAKPLFGGTAKQPASGAFTPKPLGGTSPLGDLGKMFETGKGGFGPKKPAASTAPQFSQADLDAMAAQNQAKDQEEIAKRQAELEQIKLQHKQLHDEMYYNTIRDAGKNAIAKERKEKLQAEQQEAEEKQQQAQAVQGEDIMPGSPLAKNQQLGTPVSVQQAKTQTEANRGTTG